MKPIVDFRCFLNSRRSPEIEETGGTGQATFEGVLHMTTSTERLRAFMDRSAILFKSYFRQNLCQEELLGK